MESNQKTAYFEWLRLLAAAAVVVMHTEGIWWPSIDHTSAQFRMLSAWDALVRWPVPVFIMITGAIFLPRKTGLKTVLTRYIPRMALAFFLWSGIYALYGLYRGNSPREALAAFFTGHYHMWYLPFLCGLYLTLPFLQRIAQDRLLCRQMLAVSAVVGLLIPWLLDLGALLLPREAGLLASVKNSLNFSFFFDHVALLLLGHGLHQWDPSPKARGFLYGAGLLGAALTLPLTIWASKISGTQNALFCAIPAPGTLAAAAALFVFAKTHLTRLPDAVRHMAEHSFGIYLIHALILEIVAELGIHALMGNPLWTVPAVSMLVFVISLAAAAVLRRLPRIGKILV